MRIKLLLLVFRFGQRLEAFVELPVMCLAL